MPDTTGRRTPQHEIATSPRVPTAATPAATASELSAQARGGEIVMYTTAWCGDCRRAKRVFAACNVPYREVDIEAHPDAAQVVLALNHGLRSVPTILFPDESVLVEPSTAQLEAKLRPFIG